MIISTDAKKTFDKPTSIYDKNSSESGNTGKLPQPNKGHL